MTFVGSICSYAADTAASKLIHMAITIRNRDTEAMIRALGKRRSLGPSGVIRRLAEEELVRLEPSAPSPPADSGELWDDLMAMVPEFTEKEKRKVWDEMEHMYDYLYEDEGGAGNGDRQVHPRRHLSAGS